MSNLRAMAFALLAILTVASCATGRGSEGPRREPPKVVDPTAGSVTYKGRTIVFDEAADPPLLTIDGKPITVRRYDYGQGKTGSATDIRYGSSATIYVDYTSLWQLARGVIDAGVPGY